MNLEYIYKFTIKATEEESVNHLIKPTYNEEKQSLTLSVCDVVVFEYINNSIRLNCEYDLDANIRGKFDSIDGENKTILFTYRGENNNRFLTSDLFNIITTYINFLS